MVSWTAGIASKELKIGGFTTGFAKEDEQVGNTIFSGC